MSNVLTSDQKLVDILMDLKDKIKSVNNDFCYIENEYDGIINKARDKNFFIWVGTQDGLIGNENCHYEFVFNKEKEKLLTMIHFEDSYKKGSTFKIFQDICLSCGLKRYPEYNHWFYEDNDAILDVNDYDSDKNEFCEKAISFLQKLDSIVGNKIKNKIIEIKEKECEMEYIDKIIQQLQNTKNLVLTGAPGTGKTYLARNIAAKIMFGKDNFSELSEDQIKQIGYVQFHQSYDYTDFLEGLRPVSDNSSTNTIGFERQDGIFKKFCSEIVENNNNNPKYKEINALYDELVNDIIKGKSPKPEMRREGKIFDGKFDVNRNRILLKPKDGKTTYPINKNKILEISIKYKNKKSLDNIQDIIEEFKPFKIGNSGSYYYAVLYYLYEMKEKTPYVFIIDEINRGEVSKIFGELFNAIDPGYRGVEGKIQTQYKNLIPDDDIFKDGFYVPDNVYIIATMNDIDRSVESMDFAFRRRFAWREIKASETQNMLDKKLDPSILNDAKNRMNTLNKAIENIEGLSSSYHIGAAYFLKLKDYNNDADKGFNSLWEYHLKPLLQEYLRGMVDIEKNLNDLHNAYNLKKENNNPSDTQQTDTND